MSFRKAVAASIVLGGGALFPVTAFAGTNNSTDTSNTMAGAVISKSQALSSARQLFSIPSSYTLQNESYGNYAGNGSDPVYNFTFQKPDPGNMNDNISVGIDAITGNVSSYNHFSRNQSFEFPVPVSEQKAETIAKQWAQKLFSKQLPDTKMTIRPFQSDNLRTPVQYDFQFERIVSGIPAPFDGFSITIDQDGHLASVQDSWHTEAFPKTSNAVSQTSAEQTFLSALGLHLAYTQLWHQNGNPTMALSYAATPPTFPTGFNEPYAEFRGQTGIAIDALSGDLLDSSGQTHKPTIPAPLQPLGKTGDSQPLNSKPVNWGEQQARAYAQTTLSLGSNLKLTNENEWSNANSDTVWNFQFTKPNASGNPTRVMVGVDATYGYLTQFNEYTPRQIPQKMPDSGPSGNTPNALSEAQLSSDATAFAKRVFASHLGAISVQPESQFTGSSSTAQFRLMGLVNGIEDESLDGMIQVNSQTGTVTSMNFGQGQSDETSLPSPDKAVSLKAAQNAYATEDKLQLTYLLTNPMMAAKMSGKSPADTSATPKVILAYVPTSSADVPTYFDAIQGKFVSNGGLSTTPYTGTIQDISGNSAASELTLLARRGLVPVDEHGDIHPNQTLTNAAFIKLIMDAFQTVNFYTPSIATDATVSKAMAGVTQNNPSYKELATAYSVGWLDPNHPLNPNATMTRNEAATLLTKALGYNQLLSHPSLFQFSAKDAKTIPQSNLAADAIAVNLGMFTRSKDGNFDGTSAVTLSSAAQAVVKAATLMNGQQPGPIRPLGMG